MNHGPKVSVLMVAYNQEAYVAQAVNSALKKNEADLATLRTTLEPTVDLIRQTAAAAEKSVDVATGLCDGAFEAVSMGDTATHDRLVSEGLADLLEKCDLVVLAQASMARIVELVPAERLSAPVLSSPELAVRQVRETLLSPDAGA